MHFLLMMVFVESQRRKGHVLSVQIFTFMILIVVFSKERQSIKVTPLPLAMGKQRS